MIVYPCPERSCRQPRLLVVQGSDGYACVRCQNDQCPRAHRNMVIQGHGGLERLALSAPGQRRAHVRRLRFERRHHRKAARARSHREVSTAA